MSWMIGRSSREPMTFVYQTPLQLWISVVAYTSWLREQQPRFVNLTTCGVTTESPLITGQFSRRGRPPRQNWWTRPSPNIESQLLQQANGYSKRESFLRSREQRRRAGKPRQAAAIFPVPLSGPVTVPRGLHQALSVSSKTANSADTPTRTEPAQTITLSRENHDSDEKKGKAMQVLQRLVRIAARVLRTLSKPLRV